MWITGILIGVAGAFLVWVLVVVPAEKSFHRRKLEAIKQKQKRLEKRRQLHSEGHRAET